MGNRKAVSRKGAENAKDAKSRTNKELVGLMKGKSLTKGDIFSTGVKWHAQS
jgi:hypothetical protein